MRLVFGLVLILGLGLAGFAVYMAKSYIQGYQAQLAKAKGGPAIELVDVYVATRPIEYGEMITKEDAKTLKWPKMAVPEGAYLTEEDLWPKGEDEPRRALRAMEKFEPVLEVKLTGPGEEAGLTSQLEPGMRAFTIKVDVSSGVSGFLRPGDHVDVYWTGQVGGDGVRTEANSVGNVTKLIETGVKLIAVDQSANMDITEASVARTVTAMVKPQQVASLAQAQATGRLSLSLVGVLDDSVAEVIEVDQHRLLGLAQAEVAAAPEVAEVCKIRTRRGGEVIESVIPCTN